MAVNAACFPILFLAYNFVVKSEEGACERSEPCIVGGKGRAN